MVDIRKISVGADYKSSAMHYIVESRSFKWKLYNPLYKKR